MYYNISPVFNVLTHERIPVNGLPNDTNVVTVTNKISLPLYRTVWYFIKHIDLGRYIQ